MTMNIERAYLTTVSAEDLAETLANHFRGKEYETQVFRTSDNATVMQARKESLWRQMVGTAYAVSVVITPGDNQLSVKLGAHEWVDTAVSAGIGVVLLPPVLIGTVWGVWKEHSLDNVVWRIVDERIDAAASEVPVPNAAAADAAPAAGGAPQESPGS
jgi:hypothetical protein